MPAIQVGLPSPPLSWALVTCSRGDMRLPAAQEGPTACQLGSLHLDGRKSSRENLSWQVGQHLRPSQYPPP